MRDVVAIVFDTRDAAYRGLHELWRLDSEGEVTVHGAGVLVRGSHGEVTVETGDGDLPAGAAVGALAGGLIGLLAGPAGVAVGVARGAQIGAGAGGVVGLGVDASNASTLEQAVDESGMVLRRGRYAVIADVDEAAKDPIDSRMTMLRAKVYRRPKSDVAADKWKGLDPFFVPYDYEPVIASEES